MKSNSFDIIKKPLLTEKSNSFTRVSKYSFVVSCNSNKLKIKEALEDLFSVKVSSVNVINVHRKAKLFKGKKGYKSGFKKVIATIADMKKIDYVNGV